MFFLRAFPRDRQPELMDDPTLDPHEHQHALRGLARLNWLSRSFASFTPALEQLARDVAPSPLRILDLATGSGDIPASLLAWGKARGIALEVSGCDLSPTAIEQARRQVPEGTFFVQDVLRDPLPTGYDVLTCSLFLHHLEDADQRKLLTEAGRVAGRAVLINDLVRSRFNYAAIWLTTRLVSRSRVVRVDGPLSIKAALTLAEVRQLAIETGLAAARVAARFPCRFFLDWRKPA
jgi:2-polyprenyl-3-methyl-5-hydroxy-6-metoxy-1,4-benzoquinol methylase